MENGQQSVQHRDVQSQQANHINSQHQLHGKAQRTHTTHKLYHDNMKTSRPTNNRHKFMDNNGQNKTHFISNQRVQLNPAWRVVEPFQGVDDEAALQSVDLVPQEGHDLLGMQVHGRSHTAADRQVEAKEE